jgi:hypothetical protein
MDGKSVSRSVGQSIRAKVDPTNVVYSALSVRTYPHVMRPGSTDCPTVTALQPGSADPSFASEVRGARLPTFQAPAVACRAARGSPTWLNLRQRSAGARRPHAQYARTGSTDLRSAMMPWWPTVIAPTTGPLPGRRFPGASPTGLSSSKRSRSHRLTACPKARRSARRRRDRHPRHCCT